MDLELIRSSVKGIKTLTELQVCKNISVTPYFHMLMDHFVPQIERLRSVSFFSDQCSENVHSYMDKDTERVAALNHRD
uniref:F-box/LRR-repeat protein n=1 Tax=Rhabditophanes sp. KR3021 TaxID=114890 RepID=A0AC35U9K5_9BILA